VAQNNIIHIYKEVQQLHSTKQSGTKSTTVTNSIFDSLCIIFDPHTRLSCE